MDICSRGHGEVVYEGGDCPACQEIATWKERVFQLELKITDAQIEFNDLSAKYEDLKEESNKWSEQ